MIEYSLNSNVQYLYNEDCLIQMLNLHQESIQVDHIICDLPYEN